MTRVMFHEDGLEVQFPGWEILFTRRSAFTAAPSAVLGAHSHPGWSYEILGVRSGLVISGIRKIGVFTHPSGVRRLVSMKRGHPLLRVDVQRDVTGFDQLLLSTPEAASLATAINARVQR